MSEQPERGRETKRLVEEEPEAQMGMGAELPGPALSVTGEKAPKRRTALTCTIVGGVVVLLVICAAVVLWVVVPLITGEQIIPAIPDLSGILGPPGDEILLAFPSRRGDVELYLLELGQDEKEGTFLAEDAERFFTVFLLLEEETHRRRIGGDYGGFVPGSDRLFLWYRLEDEIVIQQMRVGDEEPTDVMDSKADYLWGTVVKDPEIVFLEEFRDGGQRCYVARPGGEAERVAKADGCDISRDGLTIYFSERDKGETTLSVIDITGENETVLLDEVEGVYSHRVSEDASHVAYVQVEDYDESQLYLVERDSGEEDEIGDEVLRIVEYGFAPGSDTLFYIAEEEEDDYSVLRLYVSDSDDAIAEGPALGADFTPDGQYLVYLLGDEDGEETLYVHPLGGGGDVKVLDGEEIQYAVLRTSPPRVLALSTEEGEFTLYSVSVDGGDVVELLDEEDASFEAEYVPNESLLYVQITNEDGEVSLFVAPLGGEDEGYTLLEEWARIEILNSSPDGSQLVLWAREDWGDDPVLYSIAVEDGADPVELDDDAEGFRNAVFTSDGQYVLYTAVTGDESDDVEVHQVRVDGEEKYEVLYEEALLVDVRWDDIAPWYLPLGWQTTAEGVAEVPIEIPTEEPVVEVTVVVEVEVTVPPTEAPVVVTATPIPTPIEKAVIRWFVGVGTGTDSEQVLVEEAVVEAFNASQDRIKLELEIVEDDALMVLLAEIAAGIPPDIVGPATMWRANELADMWLGLDFLVWDYDLSDYNWTGLEVLWLYDQGLIGLPVGLYPSFIYYNRDLFDEAGLAYPPDGYGEPYADGDPWTVEKMEEIAMLLTLDADGNNATSPDFDPENIVQFGYHTQWLSLRGQANLFGAGSFVDADGNATLPDHWREAFHWYYEGIWEKYFMPNEEYLWDDSNPFDSGNVAMTHSDLWYTCCVDDVPNWDIAPVPSYEGQTTANFQADMLGILNTTEYPEEAMEALYYLANNPELIEVWGGMPPQESLQADFFTEFDERFPQGVDWEVAVESLYYFDIPSHEGYMPNFSMADERLWDFKTLYESTPGLDLDTELDLLVADLQEIFDAAED